ncbi:uncharacterized protein MONBRDRAFT_37665 [Monosiga brevicollis MX1]|uniref:RNA exonuclease 4 n=1 Tax=Monosiga brevicollis TaxID=81824 RepID=A9V359_MONBE|nr:uncharacterized protein MONBRDRAFT_37665 [Monosiga brevicollis MX1]EDQ88131.1 predicted protein [Monosiga brevicollis MX1]|eukprot:XP_001747207.1 hypothetical protein [Monosiga brevicollis MX1]
MGNRAPSLFRPSETWLAARGVLQDLTKTKSPPNNRVPKSHISPDSRQSASLLQHSSSNSTAVSEAASHAPPRVPERSPEAEQMLHQLLAQLGSFQALQAFEQQIDRPLYALDCEMVTVRGKGGAMKSALGRISIINATGQVVIDEFVRPQQPIVSYNTRWSGIRKRDLVDATPFPKVRDRLRTILKNARVVGHAVSNDFRAMNLTSKELNALVYDTSASSTLKIAALGENDGNAVSLKRLSKYLLHRTIQEKQHCSLIDARVTLELYQYDVNLWRSHQRLRS